MATWTSRNTCGQRAPENAVDCASEPGRSPSGCEGTARVPLAVPTLKGDQVLTKKLAILASSVALAIGLDRSARGRGRQYRDPRSVDVGPRRRRLSGAPDRRQRRPLVSFGAPDVTDTAYAVLGLHAAGVGAKQSATAIAFLKTKVAGWRLGRQGRSRRARLRHHGGGHVATGPAPFRRPQAGEQSRDAIARDRAHVRSRCRLVRIAPTRRSTARFAKALHSPRWPRPASGGAGSSCRPSWLIRQQCGNGLWTSYRPDVSVPCPAADPNTFVGPDTNSTGMAVQGLAAYQVYPNVFRTAVSLARVQSSDGGYPFVAAPGQSSDPDSTALVIQALIAEHGRPSAAVGALTNFQLGCSDPVDPPWRVLLPGR